MGGGGGGGWWGGGGLGVEKTKPGENNLPLIGLNFVGIYFSKGEAVGPASGEHLQSQSGVRIIEAGLSEHVEGERKVINKRVSNATAGAGSNRPWGSKKGPQSLELKTITLLQETLSPCTRRGMDRGIKRAGLRKRDQAGTSPDHKRREVGASVYRGFLYSNLTCFI